MLIGISEAEGAVEPQEAELMQKAFRLGDLRADTIMTPRTEIVWVEKDATLSDFLGIYAKETHTRFPVHGEEVDDVLGVLYVKDVLKAFVDKSLGDQDPVAQLARPAFFYPESKQVDRLFLEMRTEGAQMVMLVDEHGGIAGLLTLKRIVGEVVGAFSGDEEGEEPEFQTIDEQTIQVDGGMRVEEVNERFDLELPEGEYDTLAGFILDSLGHIPREGEMVRHQGLLLTVAEMNGVKIETVLVRKG